MKFITTLAVRWLTWQLRKDKDFYYAYKANIAVCIQDRYKKHAAKTIESCLHEFSNACADDFMQLWITKR